MASANIPGSPLGSAFDSKPGRNRFETKIGGGGNNPLFHGKDSQAIGRLDLGGWNGGTEAHSPIALVRKKRTPGRCPGREGGELLGGQTCPEIKEDLIPGIDTCAVHGIRRGTFTLRKNRPKLSLNRETTCPKLGCGGPGDCAAWISSRLAAAATLGASAIRAA